MKLSKDAIAVLDSLAAMGNLVEVADKDGVYIYCSENCTYDAQRAQDLIGKHILDAFDLTEETSVLLATLRTGKPQRDIFLRYVSRMTGREHYWLYNAFPITIGGQLEGALAVYRTVGAIKNIAQEWENMLPSDRAKRGNLSTSKNGLYTFQDIICSSEEMIQAIETAKKISRRDSSVLLTGETGTGKELFAQSIHSYGPKKDKPFVAVNCAAIPDNLLESILFGVAKGAYTGAVEKRGLFEESSEGTIFLDELQALNPDMQAKLLRVLETKRVRRVGGDREIPINPRVISAMNINPRESIATGKLKPDLFYRIAVITIDVPPLRRRKKDIPLLAKSFISQVNEQLVMNIETCSDQVWQIFEEYPWPGNVRELKHVIEYAANVMEETEACIRPSHLPDYLQYRDCGESAGDFVREPLSGERYPIGDYKIIRQQALNEFSDVFNRTFLTQALKKFHGNVSQTARAINISRQHLHELINKYDLSDIL